MNRFQVRILGRFGFDMDGKSVPLPSRGNELIAFLAVQPGGCASRRRVSGVLWPDLTDERALGNLNTTLWRLRRAVLKVAQPDFIHVTRWQIGLNTNRIQVDYWEFERCVEGLLSGNMDPSSMGRALALYSGELLEGNDNADWLQPERERTRLRYLQVLRHCAEWHARNGSASEALRMYERLLGCDPLNEEACREMMKIFNSIGKRIEALRLFSSFARHLQAELGVDADTETLRLFDFTAGYNVNAIVVRAPRAFLQGRSTATTFDVWTTITVGGKQVERLARPAINEGLIWTNDFLAALNSVGPDFEADALAGKQPAAGIAGPIVAEAKKTLMAFGNDNARANTLLGAFLPDVMRIDTTGASGYGNALNAKGSPIRGRMITDDVIDITLSVVTNGAVKGDNVSYAGPNAGGTGHKALLNDFPYLAVPH